MNTWYIVDQLITQSWNVNTWSNVYKFICLSYWFDFDGFVSRWFDLKNNLSRRKTNYKFILYSITYNLILFIRSPALMGFWLLRPSVLQFPLAAGQFSDFTLGSNMWPLQQEKFRRWEFHIYFLIKLTHALGRNCYPVWGKAR